LADLDATDRFGRRVAGGLFPGAVVGLVGPLGAGKTHLVRAIASGLGLSNPLAVTSPTFVLIQEYPARLPIYHFDVYRLTCAEAFMDLGPYEYYDGDGVCLIEWADKVREMLPADRLDIELAVTGATKRMATLRARGPRHQALLDEMTA
jgi:tRNA threonylcarbamoyladenosine biosynthesis protein TsaE